MWIQTCNHGIMSLKPKPQGCHALTSFMVKWLYFNETGSILFQFSLLRWRKIEQWKKSKTAILTVIDLPISEHNYTLQQWYRT